MPEDELSDNVVELQHEMTGLRLERDRLTTLRNTVPAQEKIRIDLQLSIIESGISRRQMKIEKLTGQTKWPDEK